MTKTSPVFKRRNPKPSLHTAPVLGCVESVHQTTKKGDVAIPPLATVFSKNGYHHRQIFREGLIAVYARSKPECAVHYEVIRIQENEGREAFGRMLEASESYPTENRWGTEGFTILEKEAALERARAWVVREGLVD